MSPRKSSSRAVRELSVETLVSQSDADFDSDDLDNGFDPVQAATEMKKVIEGYKKRRFEARKKIEANYDTRVAEIVKRAEKRLQEHDNMITSTRKEQLAQLAKVAEARNTKQRAAADQIGRFYDSCVNLANLLQNVYTGLAEEARVASSGKMRDGPVVHQ